MNEFYCAPSLVCYANDNDAVIPEVWAMEALMVLEEQQHMARLVNRNYENEVRNFGDVVRVHRAATRRTRRRTDNDEYVSADTQTNSIQVPLDQMFYDSILIKDGEASKSMVDLINLHVRPAMNTIARGVDKAILGFAAHKSIKTPTARSGRLGNLNGSTGLDFVSNAELLLNQQLCPVEGRNLIVSPASKTGMLKVGEFNRYQADPNGSVLRQANIGEILGFNVYMSQNVPYVNVAGADVVTGTITNALAADGSGSQNCTISGYEVNVGEYAVVAGNDQPTWVTNATASTNTTAITLNEANKYGTSASAVVTVYKACDVHKASGNYTVGWSDDIIVDGHTADKGPQRGQLISFGTTTRHTYMIIEATPISSTSTSILLDRPLEVQVNNDALAFPGPAGSLNVGFHRDAFALVTRPMSPAGPGSLSAAREFKDVALRVTIQYDSKAGGTRVNFDVLAGLALLNEDLSTLLLG